MEPRTFIFYGASGSGKGTQAELIKKYLEEKDPERAVLHIETGRLLRSATSGEDLTYTITRMQEVINGGGLLPEFLPIWMWTSYLSETYTGNEHFIFDGVARKKLEAGVLDGALQFYNRGVCDVISLTLSTEEATKRLLARGRKDDSEEEIRRRLSWYETNVQPTMEFFKNNPLYRFHDIDGERSVEEIHRDILAKVF